MKRKTMPDAPEISADPEKVMTDPAEGQAAVRKITGEAERERRFAEILDSASAGSTGKAKKTARTVAFLEPEEAPEQNTRTKDAGAKKKSAGRSGKGGGAKAGGTESGAAGKGAKAKAGRAKAKKPNEKLTPASILKKMLAFGKAYQIETEQDFIEAARIYAEEAGLIDQMRDQIAEDGLTVEKTYKTGSVEVAHPLLSELPRHVESANRCLSTIGTMVAERGARVEKAKRDLDAFRMNA